MELRYLGLAAVLFFSISLGGCEEKIEPGNTKNEKGPPIKAPVAQIHHSLQPQLYEAVGTVKAQVSATIASKLLGAVKAVNVREGDIVRQGDLLIVLDERQVAAQLSQAEASLAEARKAEAGAVSAKASAEAGAEKTRLEYQRHLKLLQGDAVTQEMFETVEAQYKQAQAALSQAEAMVEAARQRVKQARAAMEAASVVKTDTRILAPFDGKVTAKPVNVGDLASPGTPLLSLEKTGAYRVDLVVPETHIRAVTAGQKVEVRIPALSDDPIQGTLDVVVPSADQVSRSFTVQVLMPAYEGLRSGMFARVMLPVGETQMMRVPASAIIRQGQLTGVYIVDEENVARFRLIRIGRAYGDQMEVISGLVNGARIVTEPMPRLINGSHVEAVK